MLRRILSLPATTCRQQLTPTSAVFSSHSQPQHRRCAFSTAASTASVSSATTVVSPSPSTSHIAAPIAAASPSSPSASSSNPPSSASSSPPSPPSAPSNVTYARYPHPLLTHYSIGTDASVYNHSIRQWIRGQQHKENGPRYIRLRADKNFAHITDWDFNVQITTAYAVLLTHGPPPPENILPEDAILHRKDNNPLNDALENLQWLTHEESTARVLEEKVKEPASLAIGLEYKQSSLAPGFYVGTDGSIWNSPSQCWMLGDARNRINYTRVGRPVMIKRRLLVWHTFRGVVNPGMMLEHINDDVTNCSLSNLRCVTRHRRVQITPKQSPTSDFISCQRPPVRPPREITRSNALDRQVPAPPGAPTSEDVIYVRHHLQGFENYIIGSDGSVHNTYRNLVLGCRHTVPSRTNPIEVSLVCTSTKRTRTFSISELVLDAHGHPKPDENAICRYRDDDPTNSHISNLYWETSEDVFAHEIAEARAAGLEIRFASIPGFPYKFCSDGRIWSEYHHGWVHGSTGGDTVHLRQFLTPTEKIRVWIPRRVVMWCAFMGIPLTKRLSMRIKCKDGDVTNCAIDNLYDLKAASDDNAIEQPSRIAPRKRAASAQL